jgi:hypothetical protein
MSRSFVLLKPALKDLYWQEYMFLLWHQLCTALKLYWVPVIEIKLAQH